MAETERTVEESSVLEEGSELFTSQVDEESAKKEMAEEIPNIAAALTPRIAVEHNYARLVPFRSSHKEGKDASFSTTILFPDRVKGKLKKKKKKLSKTGLKGKLPEGPVVEASEEVTTNPVFSVQPVSSEVNDVNR